MPGDRPARSCGRGGHRHWASTFNGGRKRSKGTRRRVLLLTYLLALPLLTAGARSTAEQPPEVLAGVAVGATGDGSPASPRRSAVRPPRRLPVPRSITQSAVLMTSRLCSITTTVLPRSTRRWSTLEQLPDVVEVEARRRLVEQVERAPGRALATARGPASRAAPRRRRGWSPAGRGGCSRARRPPGSRRIRSMPARSWKNSRACSTGQVEDLGDVEPL